MPRKQVANLLPAISHAYALSMPSCMCVPLSYHRRAHAVAARRRACHDTIGHVIIASDLAIPTSCLMISGALCIVPVSRPLSSAVGMSISVPWPAPRIASPSDVVFLFLQRMHIEAQSHAFLGATPGRSIVHDYMYCMFAVVISVVSYHPAAAVVVVIVPGLRILRWSVLAFDFASVWVWIVGGETAENECFACTSPASTSPPTA